VADAPTYVFVEAGEIFLHDAADVCGLGIHETVRILTERHGAKNVSVNAIGPAGETLYPFSAWLNEDDRAFGRGGTAAVGGVKKLKAMVIKATRQQSEVAGSRSTRIAWRTQSDRSSWVARLGSSPTRWPGLERARISTA
jgi:aldehyde:ferredoxin oxidoreductase